MLLGRGVSRVLMRQCLGRGLQLKEGVVNFSSKKGMGRGVRKHDGRPGKEKGTDCTYACRAEHIFFLLLC